MRNRKRFPFINIRLSRLCKEHPNFSLWCAFKMIRNLFAKDSLSLFKDLVIVVITSQFFKNLLIFKL